MGEDDDRDGTGEDDDDAKEAPYCRSFFFRKSSAKIQIQHNIHAYFRSMICMYV